MTKLRVGLLFGGRSGEHEVSIISARAIALISSMFCVHFPNGTSSFSNTDSTSSIFCATNIFRFDYRLGYLIFLLISSIRGNAS
ncbi:hypothetical protein MEO43_28550, partial [Dolichospermum sp. ST_sed5]|nr:hypothetical protein [Dolichospermum sp. ST_sed5]